MLKKFGRILITPFLFLIVLPTDGWKLAILGSIDFIKGNHLK